MVPLGIFPDLIEYAPGEVLLGDSSLLAFGEVLLGDKPFDDIGV
jgi:hypothetical protein